MIKADTSSLPRKSNRIDWEACAGFSVPFINNDTSGTLKIIRVYRNKDKKPVLDLEYDSHIYYGFLASKLRGSHIAVILGTMSLDFKTYIGQEFEDEKRDYKIIAQRRSRASQNSRSTHREVQIFCNKCKRKNWMAEERVLPPKNCVCNHCRYAPADGESILQLQEWMVPYFPGGAREAGRYTSGQGTKIQFICPYCGKKRSKPMAISTLCRTHSIGCSCKLSSGRSFPERFFKCMLDKFGVNYIQEASCRDLEWNTGYYYDFYFPEERAIVELHGMQHYTETTFSRLSGKYLEDIRREDEQKKKLALANGIDEKRYIEIDCRESNTQYIAKNVAVSNIISILSLDISGFNWNELTEAAWKSEKVAIMNYCQSNNKSVREIADMFKVSRDMVKEIQVHMGIYDAKREKDYGFKKQHEMFVKRKAAEVQRVLEYKKANPSCTTTDIGIIMNHSRAYVRRILVENNMYHEEQEKLNKYHNISKTRRLTRDLDADIICRYKIEDPQMSARKVGRLTGHGHGYIKAIWGERNLV